MTDDERGARSVNLVWLSPAAANICSVSMLFRWSFLFLFLSQTSNIFIIFSLNPSRRPYDNDSRNFKYIYFSSKYIKENIWNILSYDNSMQECEDLQSHTLGEKESIKMYVWYLSILLSDFLLGWYSRHNADWGNTSVPFSPDRETVERIRLSNFFYTHMLD